MPIITYLEFLQQMVIGSMSKTILYPGPNPKSSIPPLFMPPGYYDGITTAAQTALFDTIILFR